MNWEVVFVQPGGDASLYRLRCLAEGLGDIEIDLVTPYDKIEPIASELDPVRAAQLPHFRVYHDAFLLEQALGPHALLAAQPGFSAHRTVPARARHARARDAQAAAHARR